MIKFLIIDKIIKCRVLEQESKDMAYEHKIMTMSDRINTTDKLLKFRKKIY